MGGLDVQAKFEKALPVGFEYDERELTLLVVAQRVADDIDALERLQKEQGLTVAGSQGQVRLNPVVAEIRLQRLALARILEGVRLPVEAGQEPKSSRHQRAANTRWERQRQLSA